MIKSVPGKIFTFRDDEFDLIETITVIAKDEEAAQKVAHRSEYRKAELVETPKEVSDFIDDIVEHEPDFLRDIIKDGPYIIYKAEMGRYETPFRKW